jgi:drug/metabolite transporter (DMT)-like permease
MNFNRTRAVGALTVAGLAWGVSVPLSKVALDWLAPGWLTVIRFALAAAVLLVAVPRPALRAAFTPRVLVAGALGYGAAILVQNAGLARTSVTDAALLVGASPVFVAVITAAWHRTVARPVAWAGFVLSLGGVALVAGGGAGSGAVDVGLGAVLVLVSVLLSAGMTVAQDGLLEKRDPFAVTAVQFLGAAVAALPFAAATEGAPTAPANAGPVLALVALVVVATLLPYSLFAYGQRRVPPEIAGAFLNLEPLVGAIAGILVFGDPAGLPQLGGGIAILAGIAMGGLPILAGQRLARRRKARLAAMSGGCRDWAVPHGRGRFAGSTLLPRPMRRGTPVSDGELLYLRVPPGDGLAMACVDLDDELDELLDSRADLRDKTCCTE